MTAGKKKTLADVQKKITMTKHHAYHIKDVRAKVYQYI